MSPDTPTDIDAYFLPGAEVTGANGTIWKEYTATAHTVSPWGPDLQHGAPPSALVTHVLEQVAPEGGRLVRVTTEILGAVPVARLSATARIVRPGRRISFLEAVVTDDTGREVVRGSGWWVRTGDTSDIENPEVASAADLLPLDECPDARAGGAVAEFITDWKSPFIDSLEIRVGEGQLWLRSPYPVVAGVENSSWTGLMVVADVANGVDRVLDPGEWQFMNTDLTVSLHRLPVGDWTAIRAEANYGPDGIGLTIGRLFDQNGPVGSTTQSLMLQPVTPAR